MRPKRFLPLCIRAVASRRESRSSGAAPIDSIWRRNEQIFQTVTPASAFRLSTFSSPLCTENLRRCTLQTPPPLLCDVAKPSSPCAGQKHLSPSSRGRDSISLVSVEPHAPDVPRSPVFHSKAVRLMCFQPLSSRSPEEPNLTGSRLI